MRKVWVVVANSGRLKIYRSESGNSLIEHSSAEHLEAHSPARDLVSDRQGRVTSRIGYGTDTMEEPTPLKAKEAHHFAEVIAKLLEKGLKDGEYERLYLIVKPPFLKYVKEMLPSNVAKLIQQEIHKDLTLMKAEEIREYLPEVL